MKDRIYGLDLVPRDPNPTTYNCFLIKGPRRSEKVVFTEAEKPTMPPHYKWYRRIGTVTSQNDIDILPFSMTFEDEK